MFGRVVVASVAAGGVVAAPAWSPTLAATTQIRVDAPTLLALGERLEAAGEPDRASQVYRALMADRDSSVRAEARFRLAKLLITGGHRVEGAVLLREVIDAHPAAAPPRLELIGVLYQLGDETAALRELRALSTLDLPLNVARFVDRMSVSLRASRPLAVQLELALAPDSNINRSTKSDTLDTVLGDFDLDKGSKARSGLGAAVRSYVHGRLDLSPQTAVRAHASLDANLYREHDFNDVSVEVAAGPELQLRSVRWQAQVGAGQRWYGMHPFDRTLRVSSSAWIGVDDVSQVRLDSAIRRSRNRFNSLQDGTGVSLAGRYERALSPTTTITLGSKVDRFAARENTYSTLSWSTGATIYRDIGRATVDLGVELGGLKADERLALLPEARDDRTLKIQLGAVFRQLTLAGFAPTTRLVIERNRSSVEFYDYKRARTEVGVTRAF